MNDHLRYKEFVNSLYDMAIEYDSDFIRRVANHMNELIEENYKNERRQLHHHGYL